MLNLSVEDMPTTTSRPAPDIVGADRLPWPSLLVLGAPTLLMVTTEMLPTAVLTPMSVGLGVPEPRTAQLVSLWAAVVVVASFPLVRLTRGFDRGAVIAVGMLALAGSSALTAAAPSYGTAVGGRLAGALAVGLLWATVNAHVADMVSDRLLGPAIAVVLGVVALLVRVVVASAVPSRSDPAGRRPTGRLRPMLLTTVLVGLLLVGHYGAHTFITRLAEAPAQLVPGQVGGLLLAFGLASALGVSIAGRTGNSTSLA